jgi:predicted metalloendopeptidase
MVVPWEKSFCVLEYHTSKSVVTVQRAFRAKYAKDVTSRDLADLKARIIAAVKDIEAPMLTRV